MVTQMSLAFDEFGRPYLVVREQTRKKRVKGLDAIKVDPFEPVKPFGRESCCRHFENFFGT